MGWNELLLHGVAALSRRHAKMSPAGDQGGLGMRGQAYQRVLVVLASA